LWDTRTVRLALSMALPAVATSAHGSPAADADAAARGNQNERGPIS